MKQRVGLVLSVGLALWLVGCDALTGLFAPTTVTVSLVNESPGFNVDVVLYYADEDDLPEILLTEFGTEIELTVLPGQTSGFTRSCEDLQAIVIDDADLDVLGGIGPEANSDVLRMGDEFECGDRIVFTFSHSDAILDFDVTSEVRAGTLPW